MPKIYLSPSVQEYNKYLNGGDEEYYMNLIANAMETGREDAGMVTKITEVIAKDPKITLRGLSINSSEGLFDGQITVLVSDTEHLSQLISRLKRIPGVMRVYRHDSVKE